MLPTPLVLPWLCISAQVLICIGLESIPLSLYIDVFNSVHVVFAYLSQFKSIKGVIFGVIVSRLSIINSMAASAIRA